MNFGARSLVKLRILKRHSIRASMAIGFFFFGYQEWFAAQALLTHIGRGLLISWIFPLLGIRGAKS